MNLATRQLVRRRAEDCCEYCALAQHEVPFTNFHIEHIIPVQHGGSNDPSNLALACLHCNLHKGTNLAGIDPESGTIVAIFHPRRDAWHDHFERRGPIIAGLTPAGRATVRVLAMNTPDRIELRTQLGEFTEFSS